MDPRRKRPEDLFAETGMPGDLSGTAAPVGDEAAMDPLMGMVPPTSQEPGIAAMLNPQGGGAPTDGPTFGQDLSSGITNPGDAALGAEGMTPEEDPAMMQADQMMAAMQDPMADPDEKRIIEQQLQLAARRRLAGM